MVIVLQDISSIIYSYVCLQFVFCSTEKKVNINSHDAKVILKNYMGKRNTAADLANLLMCQLSDVLVLNYIQNTQKAGRAREQLC